MKSVCSELGELDGVDPRSLSHRYTQRGINRKAWQLCRQVAETLQPVLAGETGDEVLREVLVESVVPAPNSSRLLVTVVLAPDCPHNQAEVLEHLFRSLPRLRCEVARAIHRRKTPELTFRLAGAS